MYYGEGRRVMPGRLYDILLELISKREAPRHLPLG